MVARNRPRTLRAAAHGRAPGWLRNVAHLGVLASTAWLNAGCFQFVRSLQVERVCTPEAAREAGARDALAGREADAAYAAICGVAEESLNAMYAEAYESVPAEQRGRERGIFGLLR